MDIKKSLTVGEIAKRLDCPIHKVEYLISSRNINPVERAGNLRIFANDVVEILRDEIKQGERLAHAH